MDDKRILLGTVVSWCRGVCNHRYVRRLILAGWSFVGFCFRVFIIFDDDSILRIYDSQEVPSKKDIVASIHLGIYTWYDSHSNLTPSCEYYLIHNGNVFHFGVDSF
jgi:hypothetical protein